MERERGKGKKKTYHVTANSCVRGVLAGELSRDTADSQMIGVVSSVVVAHVVESADVGGLASGENLLNGLLEGREGVGRGLGLVDDLRDGAEVEHAQRHVTSRRETGTVHVSIGEAEKDLLDTGSADESAHDGRLSSKDGGKLGPFVGHARHVSVGGLVTGLASREVGRSRRSRISRRHNDGRNATALHVGEEIRRLEEEVVVGVRDDSNGTAEERENVGIKRSAFFVNRGKGGESAPDTVEDRRSGDGSGLASQEEEGGESQGGGAARGHGSRGEGSVVVVEAG
jgi:hypothetical protein